MRMTRYGMFTRAPPTPKMPDGMVELIEGLTKEVLKHNPPNVYEFCANHMEQLLIIRDGRAPAPFPAIKKPSSQKRKAKKVPEKLIMKAEEPLHLESKDNIVESSSDVANTNGSDSTAKEEQIAADIALKVPVIPEKELTEDMEVEIFHAPVESISDNKETDTNVIIEQEHLKESHTQKSSGNVSESKTKDVEEEREFNSVSAELESKVEDLKEERTVNLEFDTDGVLETKKPSTVEHVLAENCSHDQVPGRRSVGSLVSSENDEVTNIENNTNAMILEEKNSSPVAIAGNKIDTVSDELAAQVQASEDIESEDNEETVKKVDSAPVFAVEIDDTLHADESVISESTGEATNGINEPEIKTEQNDTTNDKTESVVDEQLLESKIHEGNIDEVVANSVNIDVNNPGQESDIISVTSVRNENNNQLEQQHPTDTEEPNPSYNIEKENILTDIKADAVDDEKKNDHISNDIAENLEGKLSIELKENVELNDQVKQPDDKPKTPEIDSEPNGDKSDHARSLNIPDNHLPDETPSSVPSQNDNDESQKSVAKEKNNNGLIVPSEVSATGVITDEPKDEPDTNAYSNNEAITTVNKVVVDETDVIKDDSNSLPDESFKPENTKSKIGSFKGNHENTFENNLEKMEENPETNVKSEMETEIVPKVEETATTVSEPHKTDTSSMEQTSSIDDSIIEESNDKFVEAKTQKSSAKPILNKDSTSMDLETAAITIQKVFRSFLFRSRGSTFDDTGVDDNLMDDVNEKVEMEFPVTPTSLNKERRPLGISRMDTVLQTVNEEKSLSLSTDDSSLSSAATIIQAHVRGFLVRNRLNSNKTNSTSLVNSDELRSTSLETDGEPKTNKTVLNIHIVPEGETFLNRDESLLTSMELSLDGSPPSSVNLHPLGYDKSEPRKQLKREDAIQSISPPSNNSGKLSEDVDSVKDLLVSDSEQQKVISSIINEPSQIRKVESRDDTPTRSTTIETVIEAHKMRDSSSSSEVEEKASDVATRRKSLTKMNSDENDVVTPYEKRDSTDSDVTTGLLHSGEFHDIVLPTKVSRSDTTVVREFKNVLVYFIIWNNS